MAIALGLASPEEVELIRRAGYDLATPDDVRQLLADEGCVAVWVDCDAIELLDQEALDEAEGDEGRTVVWVTPPPGIEGQ